MTKSLILSLLWARKLGLDLSQLITETYWSFPRSSDSSWGERTMWQLGCGIWVISFPNNTHQMILKKSGSPTGWVWERRRGTPLRNQTAALLQKLVARMLLRKNYLSRFLSHPQGRLAASIDESCSNQVGSSRPEMRTLLLSPSGAIRSIDR